MVAREDIQAVTDDIVQEFAPLQVILFGSYAYGTPTEDSDVDLLDAAGMLCLSPPITAAVDPVRKAISPPPILSYIKYIASQVNRGVERKFLSGIRCFNP